MKKVLFSFALVCMSLIAVSSIAFAGGGTGTATDELSPTYSLSGGFHEFIASGIYGYPNPLAATQTNSMSLTYTQLSIEMNKTIVEPLQVSMGINYFGNGSSYGSMFGQGLNIYAPHFNVRLVWRMGENIKRFYVGGGINAAYWAGNGAKDLAGNKIGKGTGYQVFAGCYLGASNFQIEPGFVSFSGSNGVSASGGYIKLGLGF